MAVETKKGGESHLNILLHMFAHAVQCVIEQLHQKGEQKRETKNEHCVARV